MIFFSFKTSFALIITLLKFKKRSKIKSKYLDLFMKRLPFANDQGEDRLLCMQVRHVSPTSFSHLQIAPGERQGLLQHHTLIPGSHNAVSMRPVKQMLTNMLLVVRSPGQAGSEPSCFTSSPSEHARPRFCPCLRLHGALRLPASLCGPLRPLTTADLLPGRLYTMSSLPVNIHQAATFKQLGEPHLFSGAF